MVYRREGTVYLFILPNTIEPNLLSYVLNINTMIRTWLILAPTAHYYQSGDQLVFVRRTKRVYTSCLATPRQQQPTPAPR